MRTAGRKFYQTLHSRWYHYLESSTEPKAETKSRRSDTEEAAIHLSPSTMFYSKYISLQDLPSVDAGRNRGLSMEEGILRIVSYGIDSESISVERAR